MNVYDKFPVSGEEAREKGQFYKITSDTAIKTVSGKKNPVLLEFRVSNDFVNLGVITIPAGGIGPRQTEYDSHKGDAVLYVEEGPITFYFPDTKKVFQVEKSEFMFIPENTVYKMINYTGKVVKAVFIVAPEM